MTNTIQEWFMTLKAATILKANQIYQFIETKLGTFTITQSKRDLKMED
jgi:hypothetical protein